MYFYGEWSPLFFVSHRAIKKVRAGPALLVHRFAMFPAGISCIPKCVITCTSTDVLWLYLSSETYHYAFKIEASDRSLKHHENLTFTAWQLGIPMCSPSPHSQTTVPSSARIVTWNFTCDHVSRRSLLMCRATYAFPFSFSSTTYEPDSKIISPNFSNIALVQTFAACSSIGTPFLRTLDFCRTDKDKSQMGLTG